MQADVFGNSHMVLLLLAPRLQRTISNFCQTYRRSTDVMQLDKPCMHLLYLQHCLQRNLERVHIHITLA